MHEDVRVLFHELAGMKPAARDDYYFRYAVATTVRDEIESLLSYDETRGSSLTGMVGAAAEQYLLSTAPVSQDGRCGSFRLIRPLGNGGMGAVYLAERADGEVRQRAAIKFLHSGTDTPSFRERFLRERQILASLNHPSIARLLDAGHSDGHPYLVMEYVDGERIDQYARGFGARAIVSLFIKVAEAVSYAHRNLVIHRDVKPSNILVDGNGQPKLLDFGIAKIIDAAEDTRTVDRAHTPEYASPEQLRGEAQSTATDIYSLGAVLYRLVTGNSPRQPAAQPDGGIPEDLAAIMRMAMRDEPDDRYGSVDLLISDLRAYLEHRPVRARRSNVLYSARKFLRRRWLPVAAATIALTGIVAGLVVADRQRVVAQRRFEQVRQLSRKMLDLDVEIRNLPGSTHARNRIVTASIAYLRRLDATRTTDLQLAFEIAGAYHQVARVQGVPVNTNLGQLKQAAESLAKAESYIEPVLRAPGFAHRREALLTGAMIAQDATILAQIDKRDADSMAFSRKGAARLEELLSFANLTANESAAASQVYANLALARSNMHYLDTAADFARRSVDLARKAGGGPAQLGKSLSILANTARFSGDLDGALLAVRESHAMAEANLDPQKADTVFQLLAAIWREGVILGELNNISLQRPREALPLLQRAFDVAETMAMKDPNDYSSRSYVSMAGRELADILRDSEPARALAIYDQARTRVLETKNNAKAKRDEVWLLAGSSYALRHLNRPAEARARIDTALAILRGLKAYPADAVEPGEESDATLRALADHYAATGDVGAAFRTYEDLLGKLMAAHPQPQTDLRHANNLSRLYLDLGNLKLHTGRTSEATTLYEQRIKLWRYWESRLTGNVFVQRQLAATPGAGQMLLSAQR